MEDRSSSRSGSGSRPGLSPVRRRPIACSPGRTFRLTADDNATIPSRWPSSKKTVSLLLADYLGADRASDAVEPKEGHRTGAALTLKMKKDHKNDQDRPEGSSEENRPLGGSMRYMGRRRFDKSSPNRKEKPESAPPTTTVDGTMLRRTDLGIDIPSSESDHTGSSTKGARSPNVPPTRRKKKKSAVRTSTALTRTSTVPSQWAVSPARSNSPPLPRHSGGARTPSRPSSGLRPTSPEKGRKVGRIISMGLDLFRRKSETGSVPGSGSDSTTSFKALTPSTSFTVAADAGHQLRLAQNCLIRWQYVNSRSDSINQTKASESESALVSAWVGIANLRASVMHKRMQMGREKLKVKVYRVLGSQIKPLEAWGTIGKRHTECTSTTKDCLEAAVCRLPIVDQAKADAQLLSIWFRQASSLTATMNTTVVRRFSTPVKNNAQDTLKLLQELARVAAEERALLEECLGAMRYYSSLQIQEQSLRCHLVQLKSSRQHNFSDGRDRLTNRVSWT